jgi:hypothetical protein
MLISRKSAIADQFKVLEAAPDLTLLTKEELRLAIRLAPDDMSKDATLAFIGRRAASSVAIASKFRRDVSKPLTVRAESVQDTFHLRYPVDELMLSRRFVSSISSLTENGSVLTDADFVVLPESGLVKRRQSGCDVWWPRGEHVIEYVAGFATVPDELKEGISELVQIRYSEGGRDPLAKSVRVDIPDVEEREIGYWVGHVPGSDSGGPLPESVATKLSWLILPTFG